MSPGKLFKKHFFLTAFAFFYAANFYSSFANANGCAKHNVANQDINKHTPTCQASVKEIGTSEEAIKKLIEETKTANADKVISLPPGEVNPTIILEAKKTLERAAALHASVAEKAKKSGEALVAAIGKSKTAMRDMGTKRSEHLRKIESELKPKAQMLTIEWQSYKDRLRKQELERNEPYYKYRKDEVEARIQGVANRMKDYASQITDTNREIQKIQGWIKELEGAIGDHSALSRQAEGRNFPALKRIYADNNEAAKKVAEMAAKLNPSSLKTAEDVQKIIEEPQSESTISGVVKEGEEDPLSGYGAWGEQVREGRDSVERGNTIKAESPEEESFVGQVIRQAEADSEDGLARVRADTETLGGPEGVRKEYEGWLTELNAKKSAIGEGTFISEGEERDAVRMESARKAADEYNEIYYKGTQNLALAQLAAEDGIKPVNTGALSEVIEMPVNDGVHAVTNEKYVSINGNTGSVGSALETAANPDFAKEIIRKQAAMDVTVANQYAANAEKYAKVQNAPTLFGENVSFADRLRVIGGTDFKDANSRFIIEENRFAAGVVASGNEENTKQVQDALWEARARLIPETGISVVPLLGSGLDVSISENWEGTTKVNALQSGYNSSYTGQMDDAWWGTKMSYGGAVVDVATLGVGKKVVMAEKGAATIGANIAESTAPKFSAQLVDTYNVRVLTEPVTVKYTPVVDNSVRVADDIPVIAKSSNSYEATPEQLAAGQARRGPTADQYNSYALEQQQIVAGNARRGATADEIKSFQTEQQQIIAGKVQRGPTADQYNNYTLEQRQITAGQASRGATADEYNSHVALQKQIEAGKKQNGAGFGERAAYQAELDRKALETKRIETEGRRSGESFGERQRYIDEQAAEAKRIADEAARKADELAKAKAAAAERVQIDEYKAYGNSRSISDADKRLADQVEADRLAEEARLQARIDADNARKARLEAEATRKAEQLAKERAIESARIHDELLAKQAKELEEARIAKERSDAIVRTEEANREAARKRVLAAKKQAEIEEARKAEELAEAQAKAARERAAEGARIHDELLAKQAKELEEARLAAKRDEAIVATEKANREAAARRAQELTEQARRSRGITIDEGTRNARAAEVRAITVDNRAEAIADTVRTREIGEVATRQAGDRRFIDDVANDNVNPARAAELEQERLARELTRQKKAQEAAEAAAREKELAYQNELRLLREKQLFQEEELRKLRLAKAEKEAAEAVRLEAIAKARKAEEELRAARLAAQRTAARNSKVAEEAAARRIAQNERLVANGNVVNTTSTAAEVSNAVGGIISGVANAVNAQKRAGSSIGGLTQQVYKNAEAAPNVVRMSPKAQTSRFGSAPSILPDNVADDFVEQANKAVDLPSGGNRYQASSTLPNDSARRTSRNAANSNSGANQYNPGRLGYSGSTLDDSATVASDAKATNIRQGSQGQRTVAARSAADQAEENVYDLAKKGSNNRGRIAQSRLADERPSFRPTESSGRGPASIADSVDDAPVARAVDDLDEVQAAKSSTEDAKSGLRSFDTRKIDSVLANEEEVLTNTRFQREASEFPSVRDPEVFDNRFAASAGRNDSYDLDPDVMWLRANAENNTLPKPVDAFKKVDASAVDARSVDNALSDLGLKLDPTTKTIRITEGEGSSLSRVLNLLKEKKDIQVSFRTNPIYADYNRGYSLITIGGRQKLVLNHKMLADPASVYKNLKEDVLRQIDPIAYNRAFRSGENLAEPSAEFTKLADNIRTKKRITTDLYGNRVAKEGLPVELTSKIHGYEMADGIADDYLNKIILNTRTLEDSDGSVRTLLHERSHISKSDKELLSARSMTFNLDPETSLIHPAYRNFMRSDEVESRVVELAKFRRNNWDPKTRKYNSAELSTDEYVVLDETYRMIAEQRAFMSEISDGLRTGKIKPVINEKNGWIELYHPDPYQGVQVLKWKRGEKIDDYLEYSLKNTNERIRQLDQAENHLAKNYDARRFNSEISPLEHVRRRYAAAKEKLLQKAESRALVSSDFQVKRNQSLSRRAKPMSASRSPAVAEDITHGKTVYERPALLERVSSYNKHDAEVVANLEDFENLMRKADDLTIREFREGIKNLDEGQVLGALSHSPEKLLEVSNVNVRPLTKVEKENFFKSQGFNDQFASTFAEKDEFIGRGIDDLLVPEGKIFDNASNSRLRNSTDEISKDELIPAEEMARFPDKLDQEKFSDILRGKGSDNDHNATTLVSDGLYRSPPSGLIKLEDTIPFTTKDKQKIRLISDKHFEELPEGTVLVDFDGKEVIKGSDSFDMETRGGFLPYGFTEIRLSSVDDLAAIEAQMKAKLKDLSVKTENTAQDARSLKDLQWKKAREASEQSSEGFKRERGSRSLERYASDEGYQKIEHIDFEGMQIVPGTSSNVGMEVVVRFTPSATKTPVELKGVVTKDYMAGFDMVDKNGTPHMINVNFGNIESAYVRRAKGKPVVSQSDTSAWPTQMKFKDETVNAYERRLAEAKHKENSLREVLVNGKPLLKFSSNKEKEVFYNASSKIRAQDIQVESSVDKAVLKNIEINRELGRKPQFIDVNGYPVYAPGKSQFRAMVVKPGNDSIARGILDELGWQSGKSRGVKIAPELVGKTDNGATRLSDASKFEDSVVEFVGPQSTVYGSFPFPKDSRVVGISSSTDVVAVSARTAGDAPSGSYIMLTEIVPRNRKLVNSDQLFKERGLNSKYPTKYRDGGLEHAVEGVELDEIVNVIFIPMDPIKSAGYASLKKIKYLDDDSAKLFLQSKFGADAVRSEGDELLSIFGRGDVAGIERRRLDVVGASGKSDFVIRATDPAIASKLNREILRSGAKGDFSKLSDEAIDALAGMENLPKYEGLSFRTEALHRLNIDADGFITTKSFFRSSASPSTGILPSKFSNSKMPNVAMVIRGKSGRKIDPRLSYQPRSQEVMYPPGTKFKVVAKSVGGHGDTVLFLDEVAESALPKMAASRIQNSNAVKRGLASLELPKQKIYTAEVKKERIQKRNAKFSEITDADSSEFVQVAKRANSGDVGEAKIFADFENAVLKELNDKVVKNKDLVTAMTNVHKEVVWQAILRDDVLRKTVIGKYSDFKSLRFSFSKSGKDIERRLQTVLTESNRRFGDYVESLAKEGKWDELGSTLSSNQKNWFHAGFGASPDQAGLAARFSRTSLGKNGLATARSYGEARKGLENASKFVQGRVDSYGKKYRSIDGMVATTERGNRTLSAELIETVKKASPINGEDSLSAIQRTINQRFATNLSKKETKSIIDTIDTADRFSPGILAEARVNTDLSLRNNGILSADFKGQNAKNLEQVIAALVDSKGKGLDDQIRAVRKGEEIATESLDAKKDAFRRTVKEMFPDDKDIDAHIFFSGDDGIYLPPRVLTKADEEKFLQTWLKNGKADDLRQTFVDTHYVDTGRLIPAQSRSDLVVQAEAMEKNLRKELIERMPRNELNETQIAVKFSTNEKGGKAKMSIYLARDGENLSPLVVKEIENSIRAKGYEPGSITQVMSDRYRIAKAAEAENALTYAERPGGVLDKIIDIDPVNARLGLNKGRLDIVPHKNDIDSAIKSRMVARTNNLPVVAGPGRGLASISEVGKKSSRPLDGEIIAPPKKPKLSGPAFDHSSAVDAEFEEVGRSRSRALVPYKPKSKLNKKVILGGAAAVAAGAVGVSQLKNGGNGNESTPLDQSEVAPYDYSVDDSNFVPTENVSYKRNDTQPEELINPLISGGRVPVEETRVEYRPRSETAGIFSGDPQYSGDPQVQGDPNNSGLNSLEEGPSGPGQSSTGSIGAPFIPLAALAAAGAGAAYLIKKNKDKKKFDRELASLNPESENPDELSAEEKEIKELRSKIDGLEAEAWYKIEKESSDAVIVSASRDLVDQVMELMRGKGLEVERKFSEITTYEKMRLPPHYSLTIKNIPEKYKPFFGKYFQMNEYNPIPKKFEAQRLGFLQSANISIIAKVNRNHFMLTQVA